MIGRMKEAPQAINNNGIVRGKQWATAGATSATKLSLLQRTVYCEVINMSLQRSCDSASGARQDQQKFAAHCTTAIKSNP